MNTRDNLPMAVTLRFGSSRRGIVAAQVIRVVDDNRIEFKLRNGGETAIAEWSPTWGCYVWAGRSFYGANDKPVARFLQPAPDSVEDFLEWCATQSIYLGHMTQADGTRPMRFYPLNELTTGTKEDLIAKWRASKK